LKIIKMIKLNILIVDDDPDIRNVLKELLSMEKNLSIDTAENGLDALEKIKNGKYDLVITDIKMPVMDGIEFLKELRKSFSDMPVVVMSAYAEFDSLVEALHLGAMNFIKKPFDFDEIVHIILQVINLYSERNKQKEIFPHSNVNLQISIPSDMNLIDGIVLYSTLDFEYYNIISKSDLGNIRVALHEAIMNAMEHGNKFDKNKKVYLEKNFNIKEIIFKVLDEGNGFDPAVIANPIDAKNLFNTRGRGIFLIKNFMDEVEFFDNGRGIKMKKYIRNFE